MIGLSFWDIISYQVREVLLCLTEVKDAADEDHDCDHRRYGEADVVYWEMAKDNCSMRVDEASERVEGEDPLQIPTDDIGRVDNRGDEHHKLDEEREGKLHVPILHADR